jgi:hypothetical protein
MSGGEGGARIKIDADAAPYVAAAEKAAKSTEKIGDVWGQIGQAIEGGVGRLSKLNVATLAVAGVTALVATSYDAWLQKLERAAELTDKIRNASGGEGRVGGAMRQSLAGLEGSLSLEDRVGVVAAYASKRPKSGHVEQLNVARAAMDADAAGMDAKRFGGLMGDLQPFGEQSADLAAQLLYRTGDKAEESAALLTSIRQRSGAGDAQQALGLILGAGGTDGGLEAIQQGWQTYQAQGRKGGFATSFARSPLSLVPDLAQRPVIDQVLARQDDGAREAGQTAGFLERQRLHQLTDPVTFGEHLAKSQENRRETKNWTDRARTAASNAITESYVDQDADKSLFGIRARFTSTALADLHITDLDDDPSRRAAGATYRNRNAVPQDAQAVSVLSQILTELRSQRRPTIPGDSGNQDEPRK